jgi:hypothetical protein
MMPRTHKSVANMSISIPQTLLATLQAAFDAEAKRVARDAAKLLRVPEKDVLEVIKKVPKVQFKVIDDSEIPTSCPIFKRSASTVLTRCRGPCILGTGRCAHHQKQTIIPDVPDTKKPLTRVKRLQESDQELWCDEEARVIYNGSGEQVGHLTEDDTIEVYELDETA